AKIELIKAGLTQARALYLEDSLDQASAKAREVKRLVREVVSSAGQDLDIDAMFALHVPETRIQVFIARA
ncbi:hypothetical protein HYT84_04580, partial [Candidatus Micrarchaeota archaeon]|nr:hypothetical protein [Candidatus Micrarchaeota archaeon]